MKPLTDRVAIITGASIGIGRSIALAFAAEGAKVVLAARSRDKIEAGVAEIERLGGTAHAIQTDISIEDQVLRLFRQTLERFGRLDILVNNAGTATRTPTEELTLAQWRSVIDVNLTGAFLCSREAFKIMKPQRSGRIVNIGSVSAKVPRPNSAPYTTSKFGLEGLTRSLAVDGREHGIAVSVLQPGNVETAIWQGRQEQMREREGLMAPEDVARIALLMVTLPADMNIFESIVLPLKMPLLGRG